MLILTRASFFFQFSDEADLPDGRTSAQLIWSFEVLPAPAADQVPPTSVPSTGEIDNHLPPVDLEVTENCTCFNRMQHCLSSFLDPENELDAISVAVDIKVASNPSSTDDLEDESDPSVSDEELNEATESVMYSQYFPIKGAAWENRYQEGLKLCSSKLLHEDEVKVRVKPEPGDIRDKNAIKFEAFLDGEWHILGYYSALAEIPKLLRRLCRTRKLQT